MEKKDRNVKYVCIYYKKHILASFFATSMKNKGDLFIFEIDGETAIKINKKFIDIMNVYDSEYDVKAVTYNYFSMLDKDIEF